MSDLEVEEFLEHYGIKGMRWGVRNDNSSSNKLNRKNIDKKNIAKKVAVGGIISGAIATGMLLKKNRNVKISAIKNLSKSKKSYDASKRLIQARQGIKVDQLSKAVGRGKVSREQGDRLVKLINRDHYNKLVKVAEKNSLPRPSLSEITTYIQRQA